MRYYAALLVVSLYHFILLIYPEFHVGWNIILKLECTSLVVGNPMTVLLSQSLSFSLGTSAFICTRGISMCVCVSVWACSCACVSDIEMENGYVRDGVLVRTLSCMHTCPRLLITGWIAINVALIREAFMCGIRRRAPGDLWNLQVRSCGEHKTQLDKTLAIRRWHIMSISI